MAIPGRAAVVVTLLTIAAACGGGEDSSTETQAFFASLGGVDPSNLVSLIDANEVLIEAGGVDLLSYIAPGTDHTVLSWPEFYTETVEGTSLATWVTDVIADRPVADVHCVNCQG